MTLSLIGGHFTKNGLGAGYPSRVCLSIAGNGLGEQHPDTIKVFRDVTVYNDGPPDLHTHPQRRELPYAQYWYDRLKPIWLANASRADYFTITNELGGSDPEHIKDHIAYESNICQLAAADGLRCAVGKLAGDSPDWNTNLWEELYAPFIVDMWDKYRAICARHVYGGNLVDAYGTPTQDAPGNPSRPFWEADYLRSLGYGGGMVLAECGIDGGYGLADYGRFKQQVLGYESAFKPYADIAIGLCVWECGLSGFEADYTAHLKQVRPYLDTSFERWEGRENNMTTEQDIYDLSQSWAFPVNEQAALQKVALADGFTPSGEEQWHTVDGVKYAMQPFYKIGDTNSKRSYFAVVGDWGNVQKYPDETEPPRPSNPLTGLQLGHLFQYQYSDNYSPFNAPRDYDGDGIYDDKHEGLDADVVGGSGDNRVNVLCTYDGVVERSLDSTGNYGKYVRVQHSRNGSTFYTRYCHLDTRVVQVGASIKKGDPVGEVGDTGYVSGEHVHFNLEVPGYGLSGYVVADVVDPFPYLPSDNMSLPPVGSTPPPSGQTVNVLQYLRGVHRQQFDKEYIVNGRSGTQTTMIEHLGQYEWLYVKGTNGEYEHFWVQFWNGRDWIFRADDTSESADRMYAHYMSNGGALGAPWVPVVMEVKKVYQTSKFVQHYAKADCSKLNSGNVTDSIKLTSLPYSKTYQSGKTEKVITLEWASGEQYDFAERGGNIGFRKPNEDFWFMGWLEGRQPLTYRKYACLGW